MLWQILEIGTSGHTLYQYYNYTPIIYLSPGIIYYTYSVLLSELNVSGLPIVSE